MFRFGCSAEILMNKLNMPFQGKQLTTFVANDTI